MTRAAAPNRRTRPVTLTKGNALAAQEPTIRESCWRCGLLFRCVTTAEAADFQSKYDLATLLRQATKRDVIREREARWTAQRGEVARLTDVDVGVVAWKAELRVETPSGRGPMFRCPKCGARNWFDKSAMRIFRLDIARDEGAVAFGPLRARWRRGQLATDVVDLVGSSGARVARVSVGSFSVPDTFVAQVQNWGPGLDATEVVLPGAGSTAFLGAYGEVVAFDLLSGEVVLRHDLGGMPFWHFTVTADVVIAASELELAAFSSAGKVLWTAFVEPPWDFNLVEGTITTDVMGIVCSFGLRDGPTGPLHWQAR